MKKFISLNVKDVITFVPNKDSYGWNFHFTLGSLTNETATYLIVFNRQDQKQQLEAFLKNRDKINILYEGPFVVNTNYGIIQRRNKLFVFELKNG